MNHIGPYAVEGALGSGGHAQVFRSTHPVLRRPVAIKVMRDTFARDARLREQLVREARVAVDLHHPGIVTLYDIGQSGEQLFLVMELFEQGSLADALQQRIPLPVMLDVAAEIADALNYAHRQGVVHRDIKPSNVMLRANGTPVLVDFGLAIEPATRSRLARGEDMLGTPEYLAPEQIDGRDLDARTDMYQFGMLVYEMAVGRLPFEGTVQQIVYGNLRQTPPALRDVDPAVPAKLDALVMRMVAKDPAQRPSDMAAIAAALRAIRAKQPPAVFRAQRGTPAVTGATVPFAAAAPLPALSSATATAVAPTPWWHFPGSVLVAAVLATGLFAMVISQLLGPSAAEVHSSTQRTAEALASTTPVATAPQLLGYTPVPRVVTPLELPVVSELPLIDPQLLATGAERWTLGSINVFQDAMSIRIYGVARNDGEHTRLMPKITVVLRDQAGTEVISDTSFLKASVQRPGDVGAFSSTLHKRATPLPRQGEYAIEYAITSLEHDNAGWFAQRSLPVTDPIFASVNDGTFEWSATVGGIDQPVRDPTAFAVFLDEQDRVVGVVAAYAAESETEPIEPGGTRRFRGPVYTLEHMPAKMAVLTAAATGAE